MPGYALAHLRDIRPHPEIADYLERIQPTLDPFSGLFLVHGAEVEVREGAWPGTVVVIEFPNLGEARSWYESEAYRKILPLRTRHIDGDVVLVEGVSPDHDSAKLGAELRRTRFGS
jgi:uncharacterized protein (DUF1330 family)